MAFRITKEEEGETLWGALVPRDHRATDVNNAVRNEILNNKKKPNLTAVGPCALVVVRRHLSVYMCVCVCVGSTMYARNR